MALYPNITICITAHRYDNLFRRAVHSVKHQTKEPYEVVLVIDSRSTDANRKEWTSDLPDTWKIIWTEQEDSGPSAVRNMGMYVASGDWILLLDGDDFLVPSCLDFYSKLIRNTHGDVVAEFTTGALFHASPTVITKQIPPDKDSWNEVVKLHTKTIFSGVWKKGEFPLRPLLIKNLGKKYFPLDYSFMEDKILLLQYMLEERKIVLSDFLGYIANLHPKSLTAKYRQRGFGPHFDEIRFRRTASNIYITGWTIRDKVFEQTRTYAFLSDSDKEYIDKTLAYLTFPFFEKV